MTAGHAEEVESGGLKTGSVDGAKDGKVKALPRGERTEGPLRASAFDLVGFRVDVEIINLPGGLRGPAGSGRGMGGMPTFVGRDVAGSGFSGARRTPARCGGRPNSPGDRSRNSLVRHKRADACQLGQLAPNVVKPNAEFRCLYI